MNIPQGCFRSVWSCPGQAEGIRQYLMSLSPSKLLGFFVLMLEQTLVRLSHGRAWAGGCRGLLRVSEGRGNEKSTEVQQKSTSHTMLGGIRVKAACPRAPGAKLSSGPCFVSCSLWASGQTELPPRPRMKLPGLLTQLLWRWPPMVVLLP